MDNSNRSTIGSGISLPWLTWFDSVSKFLTKPIINDLVLSGVWTNVGGAYETASYYMDCGYQVSLAGVIKRAAGAVAGETIGTLPDGFAPRKTELFNVSGNGAFAQLSINSSGNIQYLSGATTTTFSLSGIRFLVQ